jgi:hypothetical protein
MTPLAVRCSVKFQAAVNGRRFCLFVILVLYLVEMDRFCDGSYKHTACVFGAEADGVRTSCHLNLMMQVVGSLETAEHF